MGIFPRPDLGEDVQLQLPDTELELIRIAIREAGISDLGDDIVRSLSERDHRPLMALLLTSLPNLEVLYAHVPRSDPVLGAVLKRMLDLKDSRSPSYCLSRLKEIYLLQELPVIFTPPRDEYGDTDEDVDEEAVQEEIQDANALRLDYLWPVFYLPGLHTLCLFELDARNAQWMGGRAGVSRLENLSLVGHSGPRCTVSDIKALIDQPEALENFSFYVTDDFISGNKVITNTELWGGLQRHVQTLEKIDIYRYAPGMVHRAETGHFGLLCEFTRLKHLCIQVEVMLGGCCNAPIAPFRLQNTLPSSLESLTLYGEEGFGVISDLPMQLMEVVNGEFPALSLIALEELECLRDDNGDLKLPYQAVEKACQKKGISFEIVEYDQRSIGARQPDIWARTLYMRTDGHARRKALAYDPKILRKDCSEFLLRSADDMSEDDDADDDLDSEEEHGPHVGGILKCHIVPFTDHTGKTAYMVFDNLEAIPLPPLFSFPICFTHPNASMEQVDMAGLYQELTTAYSDFNIRLDMYHLPGADQDDCINHYRSEKSVRGSYKAQLRMFQAYRRDGIRPDTQLPGMVNSYREGSPRRVLFICSDRDWRGGQRILRYVEFDYRGREEEDDLPSLTSEVVFMNERNPAFDPRNPNTLNRADETMFDLAHCDKELFLGPWQKATS